MFLNNADNIGYDNRESGLKAGNVQEAITEINRSRTVVKVTLTSANALDDHIEVSYPAGFNSRNCFVVAAKHTRTNGSTATEVNGEEIFITPDFITPGEVLYEKNKIYIAFENYWLTTGSEVFVVLEKIDV